MLGDVLSYWEEEPTSRERWLRGKIWWASRVHFGFRQLYCANYEPPVSEASGEQTRQVHLERRSHIIQDDVEPDAGQATCTGSKQKRRAAAVRRCACAW